jgi:hypothetical protein
MATSARRPRSAATGSCCSEAGEAAARQQQRAAVSSPEEHMGEPVSGTDGRRYSVLNGAGSLPLQSVQSLLGEKFSGADGYFCMTVSNAFRA